MNIQEQLQQQFGVQKSLPPVHLWQPKRSGEVDIRIAADGVWYHQGRPILRKKMTRLFSTILRKEDADYFLVTPVEKLKISVELLPFVAIFVNAEGKTDSRQRLRFLTNVGDEVYAGPDHRIVLSNRGQLLTPTLHIRHGLYALISRPVYYELVELALKDSPGAEAGSEAETALANHKVGVWSDGEFFDLGG